MPGRANDADEQSARRTLRAGEPDPAGRCVLYWMQRAQRGRDNPALNRAVALGNALRLPVLAGFALTAAYPQAQRRQYRFLAEGLEDARHDLGRRNVPLVVRRGDPSEVIPALAREAGAAAVVGDENPVRIGRRWRDAVAARLTVPFELVDADVVVPTALFPNEEYAARTLRPKIRRVWDRYLVPIGNPKAHVAWRPAEVPPGEAVGADSLLASLRAGGAGEVRGYRGGTREAERRLGRFLAERLPRYDTDRNQPVPYTTSELSAHLHFGHISPVTVALAARQSGAPAACVDGFLEELIVRRELAVNFVARNPHYDRLEGCPAWARATLEKHATDPRPVLYTPAQLESAETHDPLWNAAQKEMLLTGRMHNYLRMYWAKKILEWSPDARVAYAVALDLNDRYEMDGRDPNGYAGVAWAVGGKHDRPWPERPIFGTVRFMSYESTRRKFDAEGYAAWVDSLG
jgi:deoxyribodipyrimidine photo-lyase